LQLRYKSLHDFTAKLPLLSLESPKGVVGDSTRGSIHSGVVNGLVYEIDGFIDEYRAICSNFIIILTGGDTEFG
jgi:type III pantothenate kinase